MTTVRRRGLFLALLLAIAPAARGADEAAVIRRATRLLEEIAADPDSGIPAEVLREAKGIMVMPGLVETQVGVGRKRGHGVYLTRVDGGGWAAPEPFEVAGLSAGAGVGREVRDVVTIYRTRKAADKHDRSSLSLGFSLRRQRSIGQSNKFSGPGPKEASGKEILTYTRDRGFLVGARLIGEREWTRELSTPPPPPKPVPVTPKAETGEAMAAAATPGPPAGSPDIARLKEVLSAMTEPPPGRAPEPGTKDPKVAPAAGMRPPTPPR